MGFQLRCYGGQPPPCHVPALLCLLTWAVLATGLQGSIDSVFVERGRGRSPFGAVPRAPGGKPAVHRDRTPTPPDITPGIIARGHARPAPGVPHTVRTPLRVRERRGDLHHFVVFPPPTREESPSPPPHVGADQRPSPGTALSPPPPPWRDPRPARESPSPPPHLRRRSTAYIWHDSAHTYIQSFFPDARVTPLPPGVPLLSLCWYVGYTVQ